MTKILLLGASGFTGYAFLKAFANQHQITALCRKKPAGANNIIETNLLDLKNLKEIISRTNPEVVINTIANGDVDFCEKNPAASDKINYEYVIDIVDILNDYNPKIRLLHFSTNAVYDGNHPPYSEESIMQPVNYYGESKRKADLFIRDHYENHVIIRPITMFGLKETFQRHNPVTFILDRLQSGQSVKLVDDIFGNLLYIQDLLVLLDSLIVSSFSGTVNVSGDEIVDRYYLGLITAEVFGYDKSRIVHCSSNEFPSLARRPANTTFNNTLIKNLFHYRPHTIKEALCEIKEKLEANK